MAAIVRTARSGSVGRRAVPSEGGRSNLILCGHYRSRRRALSDRAYRRGSSVHSLQGMSRSAKIVNLGAVVVPFIAFIAAVTLLWNEVVGWHDLVALGVMYFLTGFGVTVGFHRMLTHRSFQTSKPVEYLLPRSARCRCRARSSTGSPIT